MLDEKNLPTEEKSTTPKKAKKNIQEESEIVDKNLETETIKETKEITTSAEVVEKEPESDVLVDNEKDETPTKPEVMAEEPSAEVPITPEKIELVSKPEEVEEKPKAELPKEEEKKETSLITDEKIPENDKAIDEIENKVAENAESVEHKPVEMLDYGKMSLEDLVKELTVLVKEKEVQGIYNNVTKIKSAFNIKFGELLKSEKEKFLADGGNIIDFQYSNPIKSTYNSILYDYKIKRNEYFANQDKQLKDNLQIKLDLIEELKHLIDNAEGATMYKFFKNIQNKWREVGPIPRAKYNDTWRTYHHHVERFYDLLHLSNDLRDLDFKHNLEEKLKLVERAEELAEEKDINVAFKELQVLHKLWKEEVGPVARDQRETVWERFSSATKLIHDRRHDYYRDLKSKYEGNIEEKIKVIEEINNVDTSKNKTRSDWQKSINEIEELRNKFFSVGQVPRTKSDHIWGLFKEATRKFNREKNNYFKSVKRTHLDNLNKKKELIEKAVSLKDSEDWEGTTEIMKKIQSDWKNIGHVPRKYSDKLWKEFKDACNHYFNRLHQKQDDGNKEQLAVFIEKKALLKTIKKDVDSGVEMTVDVMKKFVSDWRDLGRVPYEMRHIEVKFNKLLDKIVDKTDLDTETIEMIKFENLINGYLDQKNYRKLDSEQHFIRKKIDESVREIQQLENNVGFLSNVKSDNPLVKNVNNQIAGFKEKLDVWKMKLDYLKKIEY